MSACRGPPRRPRLRWLPTIGDRRGARSSRPAARRRPARPPPGNPRRFRAARWRIRDTSCRRSPAAGPRDFGRPRSERASCGPGSGIRDPAPGSRRLRRALVDRGSRRDRRRVRSRSRIPRGAAPRRRRPARATVGAVGRRRSRVSCRGSSTPPCSGSPVSAPVAASASVGGRPCSIPRTGCHRTIRLNEGPHHPARSWGS